MTYTFYHGLPVFRAALGGNEIRVYPRERLKLISEVKVGDKYPVNNDH